MASEKLQEVNALMKQFPFLKCPNCGDRDENGKGEPTFFSLNVAARVVVVPDESTKMLTGKRRELEFGVPFTDNAIKDAVLTCNACQWDFHPPEGWKIQIKE